MSLIDARFCVSWAKKRGITIKGSLRTSRLRKKRRKHIQVVRMMIWDKIRINFYQERGLPVLPYIEGKTDVLGKPLRKLFKDKDTYQAVMKRDDWKLGNGLRAGDEAIHKPEEGEPVRCHIVKVKGWNTGGRGNVLIEIDGQESWVMGSLLEPLHRS
jgi:hypothetical protein